MLKEATQTYNIRFFTYYTILIALKSFLY